MYERRKITLKYKKYNNYIENRLDVLQHQDVDFYQTPSKIIYSYFAQAR